MALSVPLAWLVGATMMRRVELVAAVAFVLVVELLNTAIEKLADRLTMDHDPQDRPGQGHGLGGRRRRAADGRRLLAVRPRRTHGRVLKRAFAVCSCARHHRFHDRNHLQDHAGPAKPDGRRRHRQRRQGPRRARQGQGRRRRSAGAARTVHLRLSAGRSGAEARLPGRLPRRGRGTGARDRGRRSGGADRHALGRGRQALQRLRAARSGPHRSPSLQGQSAELRRVRREAPVRARSRRGAGDGEGHPRRRSHLRGHLARRIRGIRKYRRVPRRDRRGNSRRAERLALCARQERSAAVDRGGSCYRERSAASLSQPDRRAG